MKLKFEALTRVLIHDFGRRHLEAHGDREDEFLFGLTASLSTSKLFGMGTGM
jgi:hypothetical protein